MIKTHFVNCTVNLNDTHTVNSTWDFAFFVSYLVSGSVFSVFGTVFNFVSFIIFVKMYRNSRTRKAFHLLFIYLSLMEVIMNYCEIFKIVNILYIKDDKTILINVDHSYNGEQLTRRAVDYESIDKAYLHWLIIWLHDFLRHISYWIRNWWVAILALMRTFIVTRSKKVNVERNLSLHRVTLLLCGLTVVSFVFEAINRIIRGDYAMMVFGTAFHICNTNSSRVLVPSHAVVHLEHERRQIRTYGFFRFTSGATLPFVIIAVCGVILQRYLAKHSRLSRHLRTPPNSVRSTSNPSSSMSFSMDLCCCCQSSQLDNQSTKSRSIIANKKEMTAYPIRIIFIFVTVFFCLEMPRPMLIYIDPNIMLYEEMYNMITVLSMLDSCLNVFIYFMNDCVFRNHMNCFVGHFVRCWRGSVDDEEESEIATLGRGARKDDVLGGDANWTNRLNRTSSKKTTRQEECGPKLDILMQTMSTNKLSVDVECTNFNQQLI